MPFRKAKAEELEEIYRSGYREWPKGRTLARYIEDNRKEDERGVRCVWTDAEDRILASLIVLELRPHLYGVGSIVVEPESRGKGIGSCLLQAVLDAHPEKAFMLYSEIGTGYYERFGFRPLPPEKQRHLPAVCMVRAEPDLFDRVSREPVPEYF